MGPLYSKLFDALATPYQFPLGLLPSRVLMLGLDNARKTTILNKVKPNKNTDVCTTPTIGFNLETLTPVEGVTFDIFDVGGQEEIRDMWRHYYTNVQVLLYVMDSADPARLEEAKEELFGIMKSPDMAGVPAVMVANKQDLPGALPTATIANALGLSDERGRKWCVHGTSAVTGEGIHESMQEMARLAQEFEKAH